MKQTRYTILFLLLLIACTEERTEDFISREIKINVEVTSTKAVINSSFSTNFPCGIYANKNATWLAITNWINNDASSVAGAAGHAISFGSGPYYYPTDGSSLSFYSFAPQAPQTTAAGAGTSPVVTHSITGQEDVMWASTTGNIGSNPVLNFNHKLTQLQFTFISGTSYPVSGNSVISLLVKSQPATAVMTVGTGVCTFSGSTNMQALSTADQATGIAITSAGTNANSPVMTKAASGTSAYLIDIVVKPTGGSNITYTNIPVSLTAVAGSAHMITVTFNYTTISCSATLANWNVINNGSISI